MALVLVTLLRNFTVATSMNSSNDGPSAYDILGVAEDVSDADLKRAYRQQSLKVHPDRVSLLSTYGALILTR